MARTTKRQRERAWRAALRQHGSQSAIARVLGVRQSTIHRRIARAAEIPPEDAARLDVRHG